MLRFIIYLICLVACVVSVWLFDTTYNDLVDQAETTRREKVHEVQQINTKLEYFSVLKNLVSKSKYDVIEISMLNRQHLTEEEILEALKDESFLVVWNKEAEYFLNDQERVELVQYKQYKIISIVFASLFLIATLVSVFKWIPQIE